MTDNKDILGPGKTAVITGAGGGIGRAMALDFARVGMNVVASDVEADTLPSLAKEITAAGGTPLTVVTDVSKAEQVNALADTAFDTFGAVHLLCNNAGVLSTLAPQTEKSLKDWEWVLGVNLWGVIHGVQAFVPRMVAQKQGGHVVNTASMASFFSMPGWGPYGTSKYAVMGLSQGLAGELEPHGIGVSVLCPFWVRTGIFEAERNRPAHLKDPNPGERLDITDHPISMLDPEQVSEIVLEGIKNNKFFIFTHPETEPLLKMWFDQIAQDFPPAESP